MSNLNGQTLKGVAQLVDNSVLFQSLTLISSDLESSDAEKVLERMSQVAEDLASKAASKAKDEALETTKTEFDQLRLKLAEAEEIKHSKEEIEAPESENLPSSLLTLNGLSVELKEGSNKLLFKVGSDGDVPPFLKVSEDGYSVHLEQLVMWQHLALKEQLAKYSEIVHRLLVLESFISGLVAKK